MQSRALRRLWGPAYKGSWKVELGARQHVLMIKAGIKARARKARMRREGGSLGFRLLISEQATIPGAREHIVVTFWCERLAVAFMGRLYFANSGAL
eukprot:741124-Rhodomonas_salina.1